MATITTTNRGMAARGTIKAADIGVTVILTVPPAGKP